MKNIKTKPLNIAVILPAFNEEITIKKSILDFYSSLPCASIYVINNNSTDQTEFIANKTLSKNKIHGGVLNEIKQGKGNALRKAFCEIDADIYLIADADRTYPAHRAFELIEPLIKGEADMVVGDRHSLGQYKKQNKRMFHNVGNKLVLLIINFLFRSNLHDVMSGFRALKRDLVQNYPVIVQGFEIETDLTLFALDKGFRIKEIPIAYKERPIGSFSKLNTFDDGAKVVFTIFQMFRFYKPFFFFALLSGVLFISALLFGLPVINEYIISKFIYRVPLAILSAALMILSFIAIGLGVMLDAIARQNKIDFEFRILDKSFKNKKYK
jgi:glycosyltransferase involved in cell wall biosynthesis